MGFASDGVNMVGGTSPVGQGRPNDMVEAQVMGNEPPRGDLQSKGIKPVGSFRPMLQTPVIKFPMVRPNETGPGLSSIFGKYFLRVANFLIGPEPTRGDNIKTPDEAMPYMAGAPYGERLTTERVSDMGTSEPGQEGAKEIASAWDHGTSAPIMNMPVDGLTDDQTALVQDWDTNPHQDLRAFRSSFPSVPVAQAPARSVNVVLAQIGGAGSFVGEMNIPDGAVTMRLTKTATATGTTIDLWWSLTGMAVIPVSTNQPTGANLPAQNSVTNDGVMLNPDATTQYFVKGKRAVSFAAAAAITVHGEFYMQA
jgi:hypothetical protein